MSVLPGFIRSTCQAFALAALAASLGCSARSSDSSAGGFSGSAGRAQGGAANSGGKGVGGSSAGGTGFGGSSAGGASGSSFGGSSSGGASSGGSSGTSSGGTSGTGSGGAGVGGSAGSAGSSSGGSAGALGSAGAATGGSAGSAGAAGAGGSGGGAFGGYMTFGAWHGYAWTAANGTGSRIDPPNFANKTSPPLCATGMVAAGTNNVAMLGVNLNQATAAGSPALTVVPTLAGITVSVTNNTGAALRVQIQGPNGDTDENQRWCAPIFGSGGFIPWNAFNTHCWNGSGLPYTRQPIVALLILVPGAASPVSFDFCLNSLAESNDPGSGGGSGCSITGTSGEGIGTITGQFDWKGVTRNQRNYVVQNNVWGGSAAQSLSYTGVSFQVTQQTGNNPTTGGPVSYPSVFIGSNNGRNTAGSNLPKRVSTLTTVPTGWSWSTNGAGGTYNAAYDVWFSTNSTGDPGNPTGGYLMVWLYKPGNAQPIGTNQDSASISSNSFNVWIGTQMGHPIISYTRISSTNSMSFDLNDFIKDAVARGTIRGEWYLSNIFAGFEIWSGGVNLKTDNFCAIVN